MAATQSQIDDLLTALQALLAQFPILQRRVDEWRQRAEMARRSYDEYLGPLNQTADQLDARKEQLKRLLRNDVVEGDTDNKGGDTGPGGGEGGGAPAGDLETVGLAPPREDPRAARKRALADHILYFLDNSAVDEKQAVNAILVDERRDVGDMLESLAWGPIWSARPDWETLEDQLARLQSWQQALEERLGFWRREVERVETGPGGALHRKMLAGSREDWLEYLADLARKQQAENELLAKEVRVLEQEWAEKQAAGNRPTGS